MAVWIGIIASALSLACRAPQVARIWRTGLTSGLSGRALTLALSCNVMFLTHWLLVGNQAQFIGAILIVLQIAYVWWALVRAGEVNATSLWQPIVVGVSSWVVGANLSVTPALVIACGFNIATLAASAAKVLSVNDASGVSLPAVTIASITNVFWTAYALAIGDPLLTISMFPVLGLGLVENARVYVLHRRMRQAEAELFEREIQSLMNVHQSLPYVAARTTYRSTSEVALYDWALDTR